MRIEARQNGAGGLEIRVRDTGAGFAKGDSDGIGLENVARRLELCYGAAARMDIQSGADGTEVMLVIPAFPVAALQTQALAAEATR